MDYCQYGGELPHTDQTLPCGCVRCGSHCIASEACTEGCRLRQALRGAQVASPDYEVDEGYEALSLAEFDRRRNAYFAHFGR